ncbi:alpha/beta fold hydrolase [Sporosarcina koreensis]|uniref:alpha/beta fold hydrolase n=1 Tax=Sporosarcina koreensis TaxID=334735 RepID=UPI000B1D140C|nr:alpha/beta hydrolase [Sporosarcina koreensis]
MVSSAAADHHDATGLSEQLTVNFTVYNYDRRGRGQSSDTAPYTVEREIEDIEALIHDAGGEASLLGSSSGVVLSLDAASKLGACVTKLYLFEPPFIVNDSRKPVSAEYVQHLNKLIESGLRSEAVEYYMTEAVGVPAEFLEYMKADPSWQSMENMAHTLSFDGMIMGETQSGKPLSTGRWNVSVPTLILTGENSGSLFNDAAKALTELLPLAKHYTLPGLDHSAVIVAPAVVAQTIINEDVK